MDSRTREILDATIKSLRDQPEKWTNSGFSLTSKEGDVNVWHANGYYGAELTIGGHTLLGEKISLLGRLVPWRRRLINAVRSREKFLAQSAAARMGWGKP